MLELFRVEAESQCAVLTAGLLELESDPSATAKLEELMRAAHSLKGAARIINLEAGVRVAHAMEDAFVAAQAGKAAFRRTHVDLLLSGVDLLARISQTPEAELAKWTTSEKAVVEGFVSSLSSLILNHEQPPALAVVENVMETGAAKAAPELSLTPEEAKRGQGQDSLPVKDQTAPAAASGIKGEPSDRVLRVTADNLNRLLGLAGESLVQSSWLRPFADSLLRLKRLQFDVGKTLDSLAEHLANTKLDEHAQSQLATAQVKALECRQFLAGRLVELEMFDRRSANLSSRLYNEALSCRMRPFSDGLHGFARMVRDLARSLAKEVKFEVLGENTYMDREILEKLESPLTHLLRNAVDHGVDSPAERLAAGKPAAATVRLEARHSAGMLQITVTDDGRGIHVDKIRDAIVRKKLTTAETAARLSEAEVLEFLLLPGFSTKERVSEVSGRGVGLDVVQSMVKSVHGVIRVSTQFGKGTRFQLQLPLTLSVVRTLLVEIAGEPYAFPLACINRTLKLSKPNIQSLEGRQHFELDGRHIGLVAAHQILGRGTPSPAGDQCCIVVLEQGGQSYGLVVDRFLGERELVVQPLDPRLGKINDIAAGALMEDGLPVLIIDAEDMVRSIEGAVGQGKLNQVTEGPAASRPARKRVLVVDDSLTVRELERKLLASRGYEVDLAVDGMDGWNAARAGQFNLIITDVDMPRRDGIELIRLLKNDARLNSVPVMIVSYKDREEDRQRGLEAGADYYLTKGSFHDETLLHAVVDLIGEAAA